MADRAVNWGDSVSAVCTVVNGDTPLEITWALNGMPIEEIHRISVSTTKRNSLLSIDSASPSHAGTYTCVASNAAGATTYSAELTVNGTCDGRYEGMPILPKSFPLLASCLSLSRLIEIANAKRHFASDHFHSPSRRVESFSDLDAIRARSKKEREREELKHAVIVAVAPQIAPFAIAEEPANWGDSISVVCAILKGDLPIEITWALNGEPIRPDRSDINILATTRKNSILSIESVAARHAGEYTCSASNKAGATSHSAILAVNGTSRPRASLNIDPTNLAYPLATSVTCSLILPFPIRRRWSIAVFEVLFGSESLARRASLARLVISR